MAHHKRGRRKDARSGCLYCKPHKSCDFKDTAEAQTQQERRARISEKEQRRDYARTDDRS